MDDSAFLAECSEWILAMACCEWLGIKREHLTDTKWHALGQLIQENCCFNIATPRCHLHKRKLAGLLDGHKQEVGSIFRLQADHVDLQAANRNGGIGTGNTAGLRWLGKSADPVPLEAAMKR